MPLKSNFNTVFPKSVHYLTESKVRKRYPIHPSDIYHEYVDWATRKQNFKELKCLESTPIREIIEILFDKISEGWLREDILNHAYLIFENDKKPFYVLENINLDSPNSNRAVLIVDVQFIYKQAWIPKQELDVANKRIITLNLFAICMTLAFSRK